MRKLLPAVLTSLAFISYGALAADNTSSDPVKPEIGSGPHLDRSPQTSGPGKAAKDAPGTGASTGPSGPDTQQEDERKATQSKEKMKKKPGYQEEAPSPRASHTGMMIN